MALIVENLTVKRGDRTIIEGLSLNVAAGEAVLLTGPNGAGKTTLLRSIAGLLAAESGRVRLEQTAGGDSAGDPEDAEEPATWCHYVGHANGVKAGLTVLENASFWARYLGGPPDGVREALARFRLANLATVRAGYLSAGQKRRLGLSRLLVAPRAVWLLDEPAVSLDAASQELLAAAIAAHRRQGGMAIAATHQPLGLEEARELRLGLPGQGAAA